MHIYLDRFHRFRQITPLSSVVLQTLNPAYGEPACSQRSSRSNVCNKNIIQVTHYHFTGPYLNRFLHAKSRLVPREQWAQVGTLDHHNGEEQAWRNLLPRLCRFSSLWSLPVVIWKQRSRIGTKYQDEDYKISLTWAGNLDSPLHFLSSQAVASMLVPPKVVA